MPALATRGLSRPGGSTRARGFTLVELTFVLVIVGILTGFALPRIDVKRSRADGGVLQAMATLMTAQRRAVLKQHDVRVLFDVDEARLRMHDDLNNDGNSGSGERVTATALPEGVTFGRTGASAIQGLPVGDPVSFEADDGTPVLTFHRNGSASEEGVFYVTAVQGSADHARAVSVRRATGRTSCWTNRQGAWREGC